MKKRDPYKPQHFRYVVTHGFFFMSYTCPNCEIPMRHLKGNIHRCPVCDWVEVRD